MLFSQPDCDSTITNFKHIKKHLVDLESGVTQLMKDNRTIILDQTILYSSGRMESDEMRISYSKKGSCLVKKTQVQLQSDDATLIVHKDIKLITLLFNDWRSSNKTLKNRIQSMMDTIYSFKGIIELCLVEDGLTGNSSKIFRFNNTSQTELKIVDIKGVGNWQISSISQQVPEMETGLRMRLHQEYHIIDDSLFEMSECQINTYIENLSNDILELTRSYSDYELIVL